VETLRIINIKGNPKSE